MTLNDDKKREFFSFSRTTFDCIQELESAADKVSVFEAICKYGLDGIEENNLRGIPKIIFKMAKPYIKKNASQARPGNKNAAKTRKNADETPINADIVYTNTNTNTNTYFLQSADEAITQGREGR